jgi:uncharacterized protein (TIGR01777 family)
MDNQPIVAIAGATGFVGNAIATSLLNRGYRVKAIGRKHIAEGEGALAQHLMGAEVVINLSGEPILQKWTDDAKQRIYDSRILTTRAIANAVLMMDAPPKLVISASAVGIYNNIDIHDEFSQKYANDFLATLCIDWEKEITTLTQNNNIRLAIVRLGVVLGKSGGAFPKMAMPFKLFVGGKIGLGSQWFPFIHIDDVVAGVNYIIDQPKAYGVYNFVAPQLVTNAQFSKLLAKQLHTHALLTVPTAALKVLYGEAASVLTDGQFVKPSRLLDAGYAYKYPTVESALQALTQ